MNRCGLSTTTTRTSEGSEEVSRARVEVGLTGAPSPALSRVCSKAAHCEADGWDANPLSAAGATRSASPAGMARWTLALRSSIRSHRWIC